MKRIQYQSKAPFPLHRLYEEDSAYVQHFFSSSSTRWRGLSLSPTLLFLFIDSMKRISLMPNASFPLHQHHEEDSEPARRFLPLHRRYEEDSTSVRSSFSLSSTPWRGFSLCLTLLFPFIDSMKRIRLLSNASFLFIDAMKRIQLMSDAPFPLHRLYEEDSAYVRRSFSPSSTLW